MTSENMITELAETVKHLKTDVESLKEDKDYLYRKLEKAYDDRIQLRAENNRLKTSVNYSNDEEDCISCSA